MAGPPKPVSQEVETAQVRERVELARINARKEDKTEGRAHNLAMARQAAQSQKELIGSFLSQSESQLEKILNKKEEKRLRKLRVLGVEDHDVA